MPGKAAWGGLVPPGMLGWEGLDSEKVGKLNKLINKSMLDRQGEVVAMITCTGAGTERSLSRRLR